MKNSSSSWSGIPVVVVFLEMTFNYHMSVIYSSIKAAVKKRTPPATLHGALVWKEFNVVVALKSIIRQKQSQGQLKSVLMSMRGHKTTPEQAQWLQQFHWDTIRKNER